MLNLPGSNFFKFEIVNLYGSNIERIYKEKTGKNVYGISHFIEHLGFRQPKDYTTDELMKLLKNEGTYNASTDYDRINYWFQTSMSRIDLGINLVCNYALNTLENINEDEFETEKKVVYNEAKRYKDDDQTMFWFNTTKVITECEEEDNVIGEPETISTFTLDDCINIKDIFLSAENVYNVTYDGTILTADEVIDKIENELHRHKHNKNENKNDNKNENKNRIKITKEEYFQLPSVKAKNYNIESESEQVMTFMNFDSVTDVITAEVASQYFSNYAPDTSLNDIIREKNGLTYGIHFYTSNIMYKPYVSFGCDVSKGTEDLLIELFNKSINETANDFDEEKYEKFMEARKLKRTMSLLDQKNYQTWFEYATWYPEIINSVKDELSEDIDSAYIALENKHVTFEQLKEYMLRFNELVKTKNYTSIMTK